jgi:hypothetical protein
MKENSKAMYVTSKVKVSEEKNEFMKKKKEKKEERKKRRRNMRKRKNMSMRKVNSPVLQSALGNSRLQD